MNHSIFSKVAKEVSSNIQRFSAIERSAEWQRVFSSIADCLKDASMLHSKLARLQIDFSGDELSNLEHIGEAVLAIGDELSKFSKDFHEGKFRMQEQDSIYGGQHEQQAPSPTPAPAPTPAPTPAPAPAPTPAPAQPEADYEEADESEADESEADEDYEESEKE